MHKLTYMYNTRKDKTWIMIMVYNDDMQGHNSMRDLTLDKQPASMSLEVTKRNIFMLSSVRVGGKLSKLSMFPLFIVVFFWRQYLPN